MHEMPVGRAAVHGLVLRHRRDDDAVLQLHVAQPEGREHRRADRRVAVHAGLGLEPFLGRFQPFGIAQAQVLVADPLRAGQQRVVELHRVEMRGSARPPRTTRVELRAADCSSQHLERAAPPGSSRRPSAASARSAGSRPARSRFQRQLASPSRSRNAPWPRRRPSARRSRGTSVSQSTRGKLSQAEPRRCLAFDIRLWPPRWSAKISSQAAIALLLAHLAEAEGVAGLLGRISTMKVAVSASNW